MTTGQLACGWLVQVYLSCRSGNEVTWIKIGYVVYLFILTGPLCLVIAVCRAVVCFCGFESSAALQS